MSRLRRVGLWVLAAFYVFAGTNHLLNPAFYERIVPPGLPEPGWLNVLSGLAEITLGVFVLEPRTRVYAAWGLIALLFAVFPANLWVAFENVNLETGEPGAGNAIANWARLPFQALLVLWAWVYTRDASQERVTPA